MYYLSITRMGYFFTYLWENVANTAEQDIYF